MSRLGKSLKLVITFDNPTHAFAFESACKKGNIAGRLLPVPVELTGGCGIGWTSKIEDKSIVEDFIKQKQITIKLEYFQNLQQLDYRHQPILLLLAIKTNQ